MGGGAVSARSVEGAASVSMGGYAGSARSAEVLSMGGGARGARSVPDGKKLSSCVQYQ